MRSNFVRGNKKKCYYCANEEKCTKDHFIPKSKGGVLMVYACHLCQGTKRNLMPNDWIEYIKAHSAITEDSKNRITYAVESLIEHMEKSRVENYRQAIETINKYKSLLP